MFTKLLVVASGLVVGAGLSSTGHRTNDNYTILASSTADYDIELNLTNSVCRVSGGAWVTPLPGAQRLLVPAHATQVGADLEFPANSPHFAECRVGVRRAGNPNGTWNRNIVPTMTSYRNPPTGMVQMGDVKLRL